eukprot:CAMPEP_0206323736 /NCGR_PEP_ID=MMETSP0106_2-20121207/20140_1 /ASSEMBLY_ACC=CAM_ASM_000206 /TAXON_ID=81532 /ORGANISM="Acanthoeca-like sp., Strain 10tr" /LENGTH=74 /DNA_ID=CAMNT_0053756039 /DNA_START=20 /DNA_END=241 /DNA_ORIENTATION=-
MRAPEQPRVRERYSQRRLRRLGECSDTARSSILEGVGLHQHVASPSAEGSNEGPSSTSPFEVGPRRHQRPDPLP